MKRKSIPDDVVAKVKALVDPRSLLSMSAEDRKMFLTLYKKMMIRIDLDKECGESSPSNTRAIRYEVKCQCGEVFKSKSKFRRRCNRCQNNPRSPKHFERLLTPPLRKLGKR